MKRCARSCPTIALRHWASHCGPRRARKSSRRLQPARAAAGFSLRQRGARVGNGSLFLFALAGLLFGSAVASARQTDKMPRADEPGTAPAAAKKPQPTISFAMDKKPWPQVMEWLAEQTGKTVIQTYNPTGSFTFT